METVKTDWMRMYDKLSRLALRCEMEALDELMEIHLNAGNEDSTEWELLIAKYDYIYNIIGDYSKIRFYINGDDTGELIIKTFETKNHHKRWVEGMGNSIEIFSEYVY